MRQLACTLLSGLIVLAIVSSVNAQEQDNDSNYERLQKYLKPFNGMPEEYAHDFPAYADKIVYERYLTVPVPAKNIDLEKLAAGGRPPLERLKVYSAVFVYPPQQTFKVRDWYYINALQMGYKELFVSENKLEDSAEIIYQKIEEVPEGSIEKKVKVTIGRGRIIMVAFCDSKVEQSAEAPAVEASTVENPQTAPILQSE
ncbi:MAG: hypothetical protein AB1454_03795 [Candidatus Auribacterota bacterium]|jgi:hypothetical protein|uniref:Uncharacterized protein n=1 Tax=Candidatus Auribacter fodinae TaxID=2093366 RepID=A0A3A4QS85_9BACT|nr:MAG: hypothetical protein C4541_11800 [Candidatus Auribacter fodinae]